MQLKEEEEEEEEIDWEKKAVVFRISPFFLTT
jgi:hypothetical protein